MYRTLAQIILSKLWGSRPIYLRQKVDSSKLEEFKVIIYLYIFVNIYPNNSMICLEFCNWVFLGWANKIWFYLHQPIKLFVNEIIMFLISTNHHP